MNTCKLRKTQTNVFKSHLRCEAKMINRKICILFDTMYSPGFPPTQPTYTIHLHTSPEIFLTQIDSSDTFILLFCLLVRCKPFYDELDVVEGILCFFFK